MMRIDTVRFSALLASLTLAPAVTNAASFTPLGFLPAPGGGAGPAPGGFVQTSGNVSATLLLDRRRGWIAEARSVIALRSLVTGRGKDSPPLRVCMRITQWMRVM